MLLPAHATRDDGGIKTGAGFTTTVTEAVDEHPFRSVPVTVYGVVTGGDAITELPVHVFRLTHGNQE